MVRQAFKRFLKKPKYWFKPIYGMGLGVVQAPDVLPNGHVDMCDSCPDVTYFEGRLVNSCRLDEYRKFGDMIQIQPDSEILASESEKEPTSEAEQPPVKEIAT
jgi:hypothetical protein